MKHMSGLDPMFVYAETPTTRLEVAYICLFDPTTASELLDFARIKTLVEARLHLLPPFRRRLLPVPLSLDHPGWVDDPAFDLDWHLRRTSTSSYLGRRSLQDVAADVMSSSLDPTRPPWEMHVVEDLEGGLVGMIAKIHHAAIDGVSGAVLMANLLDFEPNLPAPLQSPEEWSPRQLPSALSLFGEGVTSLLQWPTSSVRIARSLVEATGGLMRHAMHSGLDLVTIPMGAPANRFTSRITTHRNVAVVDLSLPDIRTVSRRLGVTINDVVLALCSTALRSYLESKDEEPEGSLTAVVPVSLRTGKRGDVAGGNRLSAMFVPLANHIDDPVERARAIAGASEAAKKQEKAVGWGNVASTILENIPPVMAKGAARAASHVGAVPRLRPANLVVSNVPGPPLALYFGGARLVAAYPLGPIVDGISLNITVQSYLDSLHVGLNACPKAVPDISRIALGLDDALGELAKATSR